MLDRKKQQIINRSKSLTTGVIRAIFLISMCFVILYPILYMISMAFRTPEDIFDPTVIWIPKIFTLENFVAVFEMMDYFPKLLKTIEISIIATILNVMICAFAGYGFARFKFSFKGLLFGLVLFTIIIPPQSIAVPMYLEYKSFDFLGIGTVIGWLTGEPLGVNLLNTDMVFYVPAILGAGVKSGLFIYIFRQFFRNLPKELEDAACIDGCSIPRTYFSIMIPNARSSFVTCMLFSFVWYWNDYNAATMYFKEPRTLTAALSIIDAIMKGNMLESTNPFSMLLYKQCAGLLCMIPLLIVYIFVQKLFTKSIESSGIVG